MAVQAKGQARDWVDYFFQPVCVQLRDGLYQMTHAGAERGGIPVLEPLKNRDGDAVGFEFVIPMCTITLAQNPRKLRLNVRRDERSAVMYVDVDPSDIYSVQGILKPAAPMIEEART